MSLSATERAAWHISRERKSRRWRLEDLAQRVTGHGVPMTLNTLSKVERGVRGISVEELEAIAAALGIEIEALLADPTRGRNATTNAGVAAVNEAVDAYERGELTLDEMNEAVEKGLKRVAADALRDIDDLAARALRGDPPRHPLEPTEPAPAAWYQECAEVVLRGAAGELGEVALQRPAQRREVGGHHAPAPALQVADGLPGPAEAVGQLLLIEP